MYKMLHTFVISKIFNTYGTSADKLLNCQFELLKVKNKPLSIPTSIQYLLDIAFLIARNVNNFT